MIAAVNLYGYISIMKADQNVLSHHHAASAVESVSQPISLACPHCGKQGVFTPAIKPYAFQFIEGGKPIILSVGARICTNMDCRRAVVFVATHKEPIAIFPPVRLDFNTDGVPVKVKECLEEAINCHANGAHRAAALMVRRTLEELCADRGANGANLQKRIAALGDKIVLPKELFDAIDDLRLLGNDAAHVEARIYEDIGIEETELAIEVTKEILKAAYQYAGLVGKLKALRAKPS